VKKDKSISDVDLNTWQEFIKNPKNLYNKDRDKENKDINKNNRYKFDFHGYTLDQANQKVKEIIEFCLEKKIQEILLITGKGLHSNTKDDVFKSKNFSKLKYSVPEYIKSNQNISKYISSVKEAPQKDGGEGALLIKLKKL
tara:strand:- start:688 stop:1110 length:423 start_codon:yes stop_codon:yes gene_type:complete